MSRSRQGTIYALIDPRDGKIRYIGKTTQTILNRLAGHIAQPTNPAMRVWINSLSLQGLTPRIEAVTTAPLEALDVEEQRQIRRHARQGHRLLNAPYYKNHLADLSGPLPQSAAPAAAAAEHEGRERRVARWLFGRLAQARAEGRVPGWTAGLIVVASSPAYLVLLALSALLASKVVLRCLLVAAWGWMLWESGFDKAVRELLLPHLPVGDVSALWATYAAGPLSTLAGDLLWPALIISAAVAGGAYDAVARSIPRHTPAETIRHHEVRGQ